MGVYNRNYSSLSANVISHNVISHIRDVSFWSKKNSCLFFASQVMNVKFGCPLQALNVKQSNKIISSYLDNSR